MNNNFENNDDSQKDSPNEPQNKPTFTEPVPNPERQEKLKREHDTNVAITIVVGLLLFIGLPLLIIGVCSLMLTGRFLF